MALGDWDIPRLCKTVRELETRRAMAPFGGKERQELDKKLADIAAPHLISIIEQFHAAQSA